MMPLPISSKNIPQVRSYTTCGRKIYNKGDPNFYFSDKSQMNKTHIIEKDKNALRENVNVSNINQQLNNTLNWKSNEPEKMPIREDFGKVDLSGKYVKKIKTHLIKKFYLHPEAKFRRLKGKVANLQAPLQEKAKESKDIYSNNNNTCGN